MRNKSLLRHWLVGAVLVTTVALLHSDALLAVETEDAAETPDDVLFVDTINSGLLFMDGVLISAPYHFEATESGFTVNGIASQATSEVPGAESTSNSSESVTPPQQPPRDFDESQRSANSKTGRFGNGRYGDGRGVRGPGGEGRGIRDRYSELRSGERRFSGSRDDFERFRGERQGDLRGSQPVYLARAIAGALNHDDTVVLFGNRLISINGTSSQDWLFCKLLLDDHRTPETIEPVASLAGSNAARQQFSEWLQTYEPDEALKAVFAERVRLIAEIEDSNVSKIQAVQRLDQLAYPLTIAGMLIGVLAMGHMMKWAGRGLGEKNSTAVRSTEIALLFVLAMSVIDLAWTILAGQAGSMKELNPFAAQYINSPMSLALFKTVATACGVGILYVWRRRQQMQHATWWVCLICVLLTFRWIMFDSMTT